MFIYCDMNTWDVAKTLEKLKNISPAVRVFITLFSSLTVLHGGC